MSVIISVRNLKKYYNKGAIKALDGVNVDIHKGDAVYERRENQSFRMSYKS